MVKGLGRQTRIQKAHVHKRARGEGNRARGATMTVFVPRMVQGEKKNELERRLS